MSESNGVVAIEPGQHVRSYDFPEYLEMPGTAGDNVRGCFVEGIMEGFERDNGMPCYRIRVIRSIYQNKEWAYEPPRTHILIPVNGTRKSHKGAGVHQHVYPINV